MTTRRTVLFLLVAISLFAMAGFSFAQTSFICNVQNQSTNFDTLFYDIYMLSTGSNPIYLGTSDFVLTFNSGNFTNPLLTLIQPGDPGGRIESFYGAGASIVSPDRAILNISGPSVGTQGQFNSRVQQISAVSPGTFIARLAISGITNSTGTAGLAWRSASPNNTVVDSIAPSNPWFQGDITGFGSFPDSSNAPLPIQLSSFTASYATGNGVTLRWTTISEKNNYGFEVQRSLEATKNFQSIPGSFIKGNGTTIQQHSYSYTIPTTDGKSWYYRLKQTDLDGTINYSEAIQLGAGSKPIPKEFALDQNFPNPFNPTTNVSFALPKDGNVSIEVYNILGQRVATLAEGFHQAGYYTVPFDARKMASGIYLYRMITKETTFLKKMMMLR